MKFLRTIGLLNELLEVELTARKNATAEKGNHKLLSYIRSVEKISGKTVAWSLTLIGGTFLAILSDEYIHPDDKRFKLVYLLFLVGWGCIAKSIYHGMNISGRAAAADLHVDDRKLLATVFTDCNSDFDRQLKWFRYGLVVFGVWLVLYLCWWIFGVMPVKK